MEKKIIPTQSTQAITTLYREYQRPRTAGLIVDIRDVLVGMMFMVKEKVDPYIKLFYYFSVFDMKSEGVIPRMAVRDLMVAVYVKWFENNRFIIIIIIIDRYENCREVHDVQRAADKYINIVFAVNTQSHDCMTFQEFRSLLLMQPQISTFLQVVDLDEER